MARKKKEEIIDEPGLYSRDTNITDVTIDEYIRPLMVRYGVNVSVFRISPAFKDGLVPVDRRTLYAFYKAGVTYDKPRKKASKLLGDVASYHPHGNLSIEKAFKNNIKEYETNAVLYDVHGNTGSATGQKSAAIRYLDTRLSKFASYCFFHKDDYYEELLDMTETYTRDTTEPVTLASRYPYLFLARTTGIGWGSSFSSVPFNLTEVFQLTQALLRNPDMSDVYLYPDSPRGYDVIESDDIVDICESGKGTLKIQARIDLEEDKKLGRYLVVTGIPEQTTMDKITDSITRLIINKQISGVEVWKDKCRLNDDGSEHIEFWIMLSKDADPDMVKDTLYRKTQLRHYLSLNLNFAARTNMQHMGIKEALLMWISNRLSYKTKVIAKKAYKLKEKIHVLEGITEMLSPDNIDRTVRIIKSAEDRQDANLKLMKEYGVTSYQANCVTNIRLTDITKKARGTAHTDLITARQNLKETQDILGDSEKIKDIIWEELEEGINLFGRPRSCRVVGQEALEVPKYKYNIVVTKKYVKKLSVHSSGVGTLVPDDEVIALFTKVTDDKSLYIVDDLGKTYYIKMDKLKPTSSTARGNELVSMFGVKGNPIIAFMHNKKNQSLISDYNMVMFTESGIIKQSKLENYITNRTELQGISLNDGDKVCHAMIYGPEDYEVSPYVLIYTKLGYGIAMDLQTIPCTDRVTKGSNYLKLDDGDSVRGICDTHEDKLFVLSEKGYGKVCEMDDIFKTSKRRATMIRITGLGDGDSVYKIVPHIQNEYPKYSIILQSGTKVEIDKSDIDLTTRVSKGKKLVPVKRGDSIIKIREV